MTPTLGAVGVGCGGNRRGSYGTVSARVRRRPRMRQGRGPPSTTPSQPQTTSPLKASRASRGGSGEFLAPWPRAYAPRGRSGAPEGRDRRATPGVRCKLLRCVESVWPWPPPSSCRRRLLPRRSSANRWASPTATPCAAAAAFASGSGAFRRPNGTTQAARPRPGRLPRSPAAEICAASGRGRATTASWPAAGSAPPMWRAPWSPQAMLRIGRASLAGSTRGPSAGHCAIKHTNTLRGRGECAIQHT